MQYSKLKHLIVSSTSPEGAETVTIPADLFRHLLEAALRSKCIFDEKFYLSSNADIRAAIQQHKISSAEEHYYRTGYFEDRLPKKFVVDERYYIDHNPDIAEAMKKGVIKSVQQHFDYSGFREGRAPYGDFSLF